MSFPVWLLAVPVVSLVVYLITTRTSAAAKDEKQLPSPKGVPVLGNVLDIPRERPWIKFAHWGEELGPIYKLNILGQTHVVLSDDKIAQTLLGERGLQYSDRPWFNFASGLLTGNLHILLLSYNDRFRRYRKFLHSVMSNTAASKYESVQIIEAKRMLDSLISAPEQYDRWLDRFSASLTVRLIYGKRVETGDEEFLKTLHDIIHTLEHVGAPGSHICDWFPSLLLLPDWIARFKKTARRLHEREANFFKSLVNDARLEIAAGTAQPSFARRLVEGKATGELSEIEGAYLLGVVFEAGADTMAAQMKSFCLAMCLYPEWQDKMQTELDAVCGERMPEFVDMPNLPITRAVLVEVARWRPASPGGFPHVLSQDDTYDGYHFKKGFIFHPNTWAIMRTPDLYPSPNDFNPARWLTPTYPTFRSPLSQYPSLSSTPIFGYGRRQCPGLYIAERSLFIQAAYIGWACTLKGKEGVKIPDHDFTSGLAPAPRRWDFEVTARKGRGEVVGREARVALEMDPLKPKNNPQRVERIAFKRDGAFSPDF